MLLFRKGVNDPPGELPLPPLPPRSIIHPPKPWPGVDGDTLHGHIKNTKIYNRALTDMEMLERKSMYTNKELLRSYIILFLVFAVGGVAISLAYGFGSFLHLAITGQCG